MRAHPQASAKLVAYAERNGYGRPFTSDDDVWSRYFEPSFGSCFQRWNPLKGVRNQAGLTFEFELALVENKELPNAVCGHDGECHYVLIDHTFPMFLLEFFNRLLCSSAILKDIGDAQGELPCRQKGFLSPPGFGLMAGEAEIRHIDDIVRVFGPRCPQRRSVALELFQYAMQFVVEHEMAHAVNGHVHFAQTELGLRSISESTFRASSRTSANDRTYTFLEGSADKGSYFSVICRPILERMHTPYGVMSSGDTGLIGSVTRKILAGAFLGVFWMISDVLSNKGDTKAYESWNDHPSSLARALAFTLMPSAQADSLPVEIQYFIQKGTTLACEELIRLSEKEDLFRPFRWLTRENMYSVVFEPNDLPVTEREALVRQLERYRYRS
jgi:hypothetical protein